MCPSCLVFYFLFFVMMHMLLSPGKADVSAGKPNGCVLGLGIGLGVGLRVKG